MNAIARLLLYSIVFLLPLIVAAQPDDSDDSVTLAAHDPETGEELPRPDGKAFIIGTPGDGAPDAFNFNVSMSFSRGGVGTPGTVSLGVLAFDDGTELGSMRDPNIIIGEGFAVLSGRIDLSSDTQFGQMVRYVGRLDSPSGRAATFDHTLTVGCVCPRAGEWTATNYPGTMDCTGTANFSRPLPGYTQTGTLLVDYGCRAMDITNFDAEYAEVTMQRVHDECGYEGYAVGVPMENRFTFDVQTEEFIIGKLHMELEQQGTTCILERDFEARFND